MTDPLDNCRFVQAEISHKPVNRSVITHRTQNKHLSLRAQNHRRRRLGVIAPRRRIRCAGAEAALVSTSGARKPNAVRCEPRQTLPNQPPLLRLPAWLRVRPVTLFFQYDGHSCERDHEPRRTQCGTGYVAPETSGFWQSEQHLPPIANNHEELN